MKARFGFCMRRQIYSRTCEKFLAVALSVLVIAFGLSIRSGVAEPIFNPVTNSYFELRDDLFGNDHSWMHAKRAAERLRFKGAPGRLAVINSPETHQFVVRNFRLNEETWIGLRFWCKFRKLQWVNGRILERNDFSLWGARWYRYQGSTNPDEQWCQSAETVAVGFMPVYYLPGDKGFRWQAVGAAKGFRNYLVEYPSTTK